MSKIIFGNSINLLTVGTPSSGGYIVAYDLDGIIKQKDEFGVITPIGGGPTAGTASLSQTLLVGNTTNGTDIITSNDDVIIAATGGGVLNLRFGSNSSVVVGVPASTYGGKGGSGSGGGVLYLDPSAITLGLNGGDYSKPYVYLTTQYSQFADYSTHSSVYYGFNLYRNSSFNNYSNGISIKENVTFSFTSANQNNFSIIIGSRNSTTSAGVYNSPVIGGQGLSATQSNTVYLGNTVNINNAYTLPTSDGANGEVLSTDGSGTSYWTSVPNFSNSNLTFTGNRSHNTNGNTLDITTDGGGYDESWYYMDSSKLSMGWLYNQIVFSNGISSSPMIELRTGPSSATFSRMKMNSLETVFNENGYVYDFRVEGDTDTNLFFIDASTDRIGIGVTGPNYRLEVSGTVSTTGFRMTDGASNGYILQSDSSGNATWVSPIQYYANFANTNLTFTQSIVHDLGTNTVSLSNGFIDITGSYLYGLSSSAISIDNQDGNIVMYITGSSSGGAAPTFYLSNNNNNGLAMRVDAGGMRYSFATVSSDYTLGYGDYNVDCWTISGTPSNPPLYDYQINLPFAFPDKGLTYRISNSGDSRVAIISTGLDTIGYLSARYLDKYETIELVSDGVSNWVINSFATLQPETRYVAINGTYSIGYTDYTIHCSSTSNATYSVYLPDISGLPSIRYEIKNTEAGTIYLTSTYSHLIDGVGTQSLSQWDSMTVVSTGSGWIIIN